MTNTSEPLTKEYALSVFRSLEGDGMGHHGFAEHLADNLSWTIKGSHPLAGHYNSKKAFQEGALKRIGACLKNPLKVKIVSILVDAPWAVVEHEAVDVLTKGGWPYDQHYCWVTRFDKGKIVEARAYFDGLVVKRAIEENESGKAA